MLSKCMMMIAEDGWRGEKCISLLPLVRDESVDATLTMMSFVFHSLSITSWMYLKCTTASHETTKLMMYSSIASPPGFRRTAHIAAIFMQKGSDKKKQQRKMNKNKTSLLLDMPETWKCQTYLFSQFELFKEKKSHSHCHTVIFTIVPNSHRIAKHKHWLRKLFNIQCLHISIRTTEKKHTNKSNNEQRTRAITGKWGGLFHILAIYIKINERVIVL